MGWKEHKPLTAKEISQMETGLNGRVAPSLDTYGTLTLFATVKALQAQLAAAEATLAERDRQLTYFLKVLRDIASDGGQSGGCLAERAEKALAALSAPAAEQPSLAEAELRAAWEAGAAHVIGSHRDFKQTHPAFAEWMASRHKPAAPAEKGEGK